MGTGPREMVYAYVRYDEEAEPWHEHFIATPVLGAGDDGCWIVYTADADLYVEDLGVTPLRAIHWGGSSQLFPGLGRAFRQLVYRFREAIPDALKATLRRRVARLQEKTVAPVSASSSGVVTGQRLMLVAHPGSFLAAGTEVDPRPGDVQVGDLVLARRSEEVIVCQLVPENKKADFMQEMRDRFSKATFEMEGLDPEEGAEDVRTLPVKYERTGELRRERRAHVRGALLGGGLAAGVAVERAVVDALPAARGSPQSGAPTAGSWTAAFRVSTARFTSTRCCLTASSSPPRLTSSTSP